MSRSSFEGNQPDPIPRTDAENAWLPWEMEDYDYDVKVAPLFTAEQINNETRNQLNKETKAVQNAEDATVRIQRLLDYVKENEPLDGLVKFDKNVNYPLQNNRLSLFQVCS